MRLAGSLGTRKFEGKAAAAVAAGQVSAKPKEPHTQPSSNITQLDTATTRTNDRAQTAQYSSTAQHDQEGHDVTTHERLEHHSAVATLNKRHRALPPSASRCIPQPPACLPVCLPGMTSVRRFRCTDLFRISSVNLDALTETYQLSYYITYAIRWPDCFTVAQQPHAFNVHNNTAPPLQQHQQQDSSPTATPAALSSPSSAAPQPSTASISSLLPLLPSVSPSLLCGYNMGKVEGPTASWHGHVSALSIAPLYRRLHLSLTLMQGLERTCDRLHQALFVDLYVRASNVLAVAMYERMGYVRYRRVIGYYMGEEDALDMRKALSRDKDKKSMIPLPHPVYPGEGD